MGQIGVYVGEEECHRSGDPQDLGSKAPRARGSSPGPQIRQRMRPPRSDTGSSAALCAELITDAFAGPLTDCLSDAGMLLNSSRSDWSLIK